MRVFLSGDISGLSSDCLKEVVAVDSNEVVAETVFSEEMKMYLREIVKSCAAVFGSFPSGKLKLAVKKITGV